MNYVLIGGYLVSKSFRASARDKKLCADITLQIVDEVFPNKKDILHFTDSRRAKDWRRIQEGEYVEIRGCLQPALGVTRDGNPAKQCRLVPRSVRAAEKDLRQEESDMDWGAELFQEAIRREGLEEAKDADDIETV